MQRFICIAVIAFVGIVDAPSVQAQPIIVAPGIIQVPYFRMTWLPGGARIFKRRLLIFTPRPPIGIAMRSGRRLLPLSRCGSRVALHRWPSNFMQPAASSAANWQDSIPAPAGRIFSG